MATLKLSFLGPPRVELNGAPVEISRRKALALLAYTAVKGERQRRDTLATLFSPDWSQSSARQALRRDLSELNRALENRWIDAQRESVGLRSGYWLDVEQFGRDLEASATRSETRAVQLTAAVELYRDDFLKGFTLAGCQEFDDWQSLQTEKLRASFGSALEQLAEILIAQNDAERAIPYLRRRLALDPLHEPGHRRLMQLYAQMGRRAAALCQYDRCRQILGDELGIKPAPETNALYTAIRDRTVASGESVSTVFVRTDPPRHNLPVATTPFIGRLHEVTVLSRLLGDSTVRLVTILAPGGMGKTRLALEAAERYAEKNDDQMLFVPLASIQTSEEVAYAVADVIGYSFLQDGRTPVEQLLDYFRQKQLLLVLDNTENLRGGVDLIQAILQMAPGVKVLATSRERLQLSMESVFALGGMPHDRWVTLKDALSNETVQLFVQGARRTRSDYALAREDVAPLAHICHQVGGMPLGILLAAAWVDLLTPAEIADEIDRSLDLLATHLRDVPERQRSIRAVFEYSWRQLDNVERSALMKLSFFHGGFTREAAQIVTGASLRTLSALADKSLLQREASGRYAIHELLRQYSGAELRATGQADTTADAHSAYYAAFLAQREGDLKGRRQKAALDEIEADLENVHLAWNWSIERGSVLHMAQAFETLGLYYEWHGRFQEGERAFARAAEQLSTADATDGLRPLVAARVWQARFSRGLGHGRDARHWLPQTLALLDGVDPRERDTRPERAAILKELGHLAYAAGDRRAASSSYGQSLALCREMNDRWRQAKVLLALEGVYRNLHGLGSAAEHQQQTEKSQWLVLESLAIFRELEDQANVAAALNTLGVTLLTLGRAKEAQPVFEECITLCKEVGSHGDIFVDAVGHLAIAKEMLGLYAAMRAHGKTIISLAEDVHYWHGLRLGYYLMGGAALAEKAYSEAEQWFAKSLAISRQTGRAGNLAFDLTGWALATYWLGNRTAAQLQLGEALQLAIKIGGIRPAVHGILLTALIRADQGELRQAVELYALASSFPFAGNSRWCHDVAGGYLASVAASMPPDAAAVAHARGQTRDIWVTVQETLSWLDSSQAGEPTGP